MTTKIERLEKHIRNPDNVVPGEERFTLILDKLTIKDGLNLAFGVSFGTSLKKFAPLLSPQTVYAFDWFYGLPEKWEQHHDVGTFSTGGVPPTDLPPNVELVVGLVEDTLDDFLLAHKEIVSFVHFDLDLYKPTKFCLTKLTPRFVDGTVLLFDEIAIREYHIAHEGRAFTEFLKETPFDFEVVGCRSDGLAQAFRLHL